MKTMMQTYPVHLHDYLVELARVTQRFRSASTPDPVGETRRPPSPPGRQVLNPIRVRSRPSPLRDFSAQLVLHSFALLLLAVLLAENVLQSTAHAQAITCRANSANRFFGKSPTNGDFFGTAVALSGDMAVVGASDEDNACPNDPDCNSGAAYVFQWNGAQWIKTQRLLPLDGVAEDRFGSSVAADGNRIVVGAPQCTAVSSDSCSRAGAAYVFDFDADAQTWLQSAKLTPADGKAWDRFGEAVALSGDVILIGAPGADGIEITNKGAAYVYRFSHGANAWMLEDRLIPSDPAFRYAESLALDGDVAVIGAAGDDSITPGNPLCMTGSAFVYGFDAGLGEWVELQKLIASDAFCLDVGGSQFGTSVAVDGEVIVIGAEEDDHAGPASGSGYAFRFDGTSGMWMEEQKIIAGDAGEDAFFGHAVAVSGDMALIGAPGRSFGPSAAGAAYLIHYAPGTGWLLNSQTRLEAAKTGSGSPDYFGGALAVDGDRAWFGARNQSDMGPQAGAAYAVRGLISDCNTNGTPDLCDIGTGYSGDCNGNGVLDECDIASGFSLDLDMNGVPDECDPDCNGNTIPDVLDIASGLSSDCDRNGIPDECEGSALESKLIGPKLTNAGAFGLAVAASGERVVIGAPSADDYLGAAYVYRYDGLSLFREGKLLASDGRIFDSFGKAVALSGTILAAGSPDDESLGGKQNTGSVYVFESQGLAAEWVQVTNLANPFADDSYADFGSALSLDGGVLLVGAWFSDALDANAGAAYVYRRDAGSGQWSKEQMLVPEDAAAQNLFGLAVAIKGDIAAVTSGGTSAVYIFRYDSGTQYWAQEQKLLPPAGSGGFGFSISAGNRRIVIGAPNSLTDGGQTGAAFVFAYDPTTQLWEQEERLVPSDGMPFDEFGSGVALSDGTIAVSAPRNDEAAIGAGAAYLFRWDDVQSQWKETQKWLAPEAERLEQAGDYRSLALSDEFMAIGAFDGFTIATTNVGKTYLVSGFGANRVPPRGCEQCATVAIEDPHQTADDEFGDAVAIANGWMAVGAPFNDEACPNSLPCNAGAVDLYQLTESGWNYERQLTATNASISAEFGWSLAMDDDLLLVGARYQDGPGAAYVFRNVAGTWMEEDKLSAPDGEVGDEVGYAVALNGNVVVIGNPEDSDLGNRTGAAYVFRYDGSVWQFEQKITASDAGPGQSFARAVAVDGDIIAAGIPEKDYSGELNVGAVSFYQYDTNSGSWTEQPALIAPDYEASAAFGQTLALRGDYLLVGAPSEGPSGAAYLFQRNGAAWELQEKFQPGVDRTPNAEFGGAVALSDGLAFVGAYQEREPDSTTFHGAVYAYYLDGNRWRGLTKFSPFDATPPHNFGASLAVDGDLLAGGSPRIAAYVADMNCHRLFINEQIRPRFISIEAIGNEVLVRWQGRAGVTYNIEQTPSIGGSWELFDTVTATGAIQDFMDSLPSPGSEQTFYRLNAAP